MTATLPEHDRHHRHSTAIHRAIAESSTILRTQVGSGVHGTNISGQDDRDEMGVCLEPVEYVVGIQRIGQPDGPATPFEQYEYHTAWERPGGKRNRSGAGDLDVTIYSARKYLRLVMDGNPSVLVPLFAPEHDIVQITDLGRQLRVNAHRLASRAAARRFLGYLDAQRRAMTGESGAHTNRPELVAVHGYDTKFAMHAVRLGIQGCEYLETGSMTLPMPEPQRTKLREIRAGEWPLERVLRWIDILNTKLVHLRDTPAASPLPALPDYAWANDWLHYAYLRQWNSTRGF